MDSKDQNFLKEATSRLEKTKSQLQDMEKQGVPPPPEIMAREFIDKFGHIWQGITDIAGRQTTEPGTPLSYPPEQEAPQSSNNPSSNPPPNPPATSIPSQSETPITYDNDDGDDDDESLRLALEFQMEEINLDHHCLESERLSSPNLQSPNEPSSSQKQTNDGSIKIKSSLFKNITTKAAIVADSVVSSMVTNARNMATKAAIVAESVATYLAPAAAKIWAEIKEGITWLAEQVSNIVKALYNDPVKAQKFFFTMEQTFIILARILKIVIL